MTARKRNEEGATDREGFIGIDPIYANAAYDKDAPLVTDDEDEPMTARVRTHLDAMATPARSTLGVADSFAVEDEKADEKEAAAQEAAEAARAAVAEAEERDAEVLAAASEVEPEPERPKAKAADTTDKP